MILTEAEAMTRRCQESFGPMYVTQRGGDLYSPFVTAVAAYAIAGSTYAVSQGHHLPTVSSPSHCIASRCMAWRWHDADGYEDMGVTPTGYCGKAGKP